MEWKRNERFRAYTYIYLICESAMSRPKKEM